MKVILINGSPNAKGCTYTALEEVSKTLKSEGMKLRLFMLVIKIFVDVSVVVNVRRKGNVYLMILLMILHQNLKNVMALLLVHQFILRRQMEP